MSSDSEVPCAGDGSGESKCSDPAVRSMSTAWDGIVASFGGIAKIARLTAPKVGQKSDQGHAMVHSYLEF